MTTTFFSTKGGSGTTTVAAATAILAARLGQTVLVVDDFDDVSAMFGVPLGIDMDRLPLMPSLHAVLSGSDEHHHSIVRGETVIVDAGVNPDERHLHEAGTTLLVVRPCYMALRKALTAPKAHGVVLVHEDGRALNSNDVEAALGIPVVAAWPVEAQIARCTDAGLWASRQPRATNRLVPILEGVSA